MFMAFWANVLNCYLGLKLQINGETHYGGHGSAKGVSLYSHVNRLRVRNHPEFGN